MKRRSTTFSYFIYSALAFFNLLAASCATEDHVVPPLLESPSIQTLPVNVSRGRIEFNLVFTKLGNVPVTEFGIFYQVVPANFLNYIPDESDSKIIFDPPISTVSKSKKIDITTGGTERVFYRSYAKLSNGSTILGENMSANLTVQ